MTTATRPANAHVKLGTRKVPGSYISLKIKIRNVLLNAQENIEREKVRAYWKIGRLIDRHVRGTALAQDHAEYGKQVIERLSRDLKISASELYRCLKFTQAYPNLAAPPSLSWNHFRNLITVSNPEDRLLLTDLAIRKNWSTRQLEEKIRRKQGAALIADARFPLKKRAAEFKSRRGTLSTYRLVQKKVLKVDLGFSTFIELPRPAQKKYRDGDIVTVEGRPSKKRRIVKKGAEAQSDLYTYRAEITKVIDADTQWAELDLDFGVSIVQKLRLRGIDSPELITVDGQTAKRFVAKQIKNAREIIVTTTKPDKYDRYLSDLWLDGVNLNQLLLQKGLARLAG